MTLWGIELVASWLFIAPNESSFVKQDLRIISSSHKVKKLILHSCDPISTVLNQLRLIRFLLIHLWGSRGIFIWFSDYHSLLPSLAGRLLKKKVIIVIGGYDAAMVSELQYGAHVKRFRSWCSRTSCRLAEMLLTVSKFTHENVFTFIGNDQRYKTELVYNGVDTEIFKPIYELERKDKVVTVCGTGKIKVLFLKGIDFFLNVADELPSVEFLVVGLQGAAMEWCSSRRPSNVSLMERVDREALSQIFTTSSVVCQFSRYEAFGLALAEGMASGCIPVGFNYGGTPEIINGAGYIIDELEVPKAVNAISRALIASDPRRELARRRVVSNFSLTVREENLKRILSHI